ncbi:MAG: hypothetical protein A3J55_02850 [Candidatus Ryanbacteria bacterium RIFCSPHIGHO2_02_FULL_45_17b]|uniref:Uncharacterized protein n=1 Tax=Candidatus Ryanbacteria bacterium RIFCSPHIGHO2_01_FULL_45_22 TaxID=1802114 RepID=A0A1G2FZH2_9BACT|nr:MAG: hypothetical protein A2719_05610 [Candidatus Ryanbacteria bacterium RIFCSPHIGHO2_01_FULL_45_22]OGZ47350.1 MAG: hypothetical protein A3J55_02850 [Candidatus Ryanbacteria bacterium RIFCSPHIGHO2_02_FULL_45_17b]
MSKWTDLLSKAAGALEAVGLVTVEEVGDGSSPTVPVTGVPLAVFQKGSRDEESYQKVLELLRSNVIVSNSPYGQFCAQRDTLREFIGEEARLVQAALKASGLTAPAVLSALGTCTASLEEESREFTTALEQERANALASLEREAEKLNTEASDISQKLQELQTRLKQIETQKGEKQAEIQQRQQMFVQREGEFGSAKESLYNLLVCDKQLLGK